jgi:hypothetical protein
MHPQIAAFPNKAFYASALTNGTANPDGTVRSGFIPPKTDFLIQDDDGIRQNVTFVHHDSPEDPSSRSVRNQGESGRVCDVVADLLLQNPVCLSPTLGVKLINRDYPDQILGSSLRMLLKFDTFPIIYVPTPTVGELLSNCWVKSAQGNWIR